ncbi:type 1 glutamine amidotransferase domain-containing protein [Rhabdobacter roseus]|uniref:Protease I n=1 Tax=Rhabdobacter roseus TaxID=1655419 RepID=A0A840TVU1_9BACT|nr:type 1 glutamine amidotransferase domain-containing protein [Rhabdobacter roseus]MBB5285702.1 protease I [Rhabdobacter roseus]
MELKLNGQKVAILITDGFEQVEMTEPRLVLNENGAVTHIVSPASIVSPSSTVVKGWNNVDWGEMFEIDVPLEHARADYYDALLLPGGVMSLNLLRENTRAVEFVKAFAEAGKPVAAICYGPQILIDAEVVGGRKLTSYPSLRKDFENAGANWVDQDVVVDNGLLTSRKPDDLPAFSQKMIEEIQEGIHNRPEHA